MLVMVDRQGKFRLDKDYWRITHHYQQRTTITHMYRFSRVQII